MHAPTRRRLLAAAIGAAAASPARAVQDTPPIAAASDLKFALDDIAARFKNETGREVKITYGSSGNFYAQLSNDDHGAIVQALAAGDTAKAEELMLAHIDSLSARLDQSKANTGKSRERLHAALAAPGVKRPRAA